MRNLYVISGVTGMTGNELSRQLVKRNDTIVIGFDNFFASSINTISDLLSNKNFHFFNYDINDPLQMEDIRNRVISFKEKRCNIYYINCAAIVHTEHFYNVEATFTTNVLGMKGFLDQAISIGANCYINCSTSEVYSMQSWNEEGGVKENDFILLATSEHSQRTSYAVGKLLTEFFLKDAVNKSEIRGCSIRFANVYSPNELYPKHIIPHIITDLQMSGSVTLLENSKVNKRTFLHNFDSCRSIIALICSKNALDGSVYNVATDEEISIVDLVYTIGAKLGILAPKIIFSGYRDSDPERRLLNTEKIREKTTWQPEITLEEGLDMCINK